MLHGILQSAIVPVSTMKNSTKCAQSPEDEETNVGFFLSNEVNEIYFDKDHEIHLDETYCRSIVLHTNSNYRDLHLQSNSDKTTAGCIAETETSKAEILLKPAILANFTNK